MDTVTTISISVLSVLLAFTVGWQIWNAITLDLIRGKVRKEIDTANERSLQLEKHIKQIELQIERDNRIRFIFWESWEVLFGFEGCSVDTPHTNIRNTKIWFILCALKDISKLVNLSIPPEDDRVWSQYMMRIVYILQNLTDDFRYRGTPSHPVTSPLSDYSEIYRALERMDAYPMDSEGIFCMAREYVKDITKATRQA
jgi:hypothetical protein